jgi:hypothetical protein
MCHEKKKFWNKSRDGISNISEAVTHKQTHTHTHTHGMIEWNLFDK